ncbi:unnamed protein product [Ostreobium quekettii]|uniref:Protein kinase domain-containing protein n=1 Tax=Ostreobium quekettii TaxID=121088 RepID=A0A8S1J2A2_9CHLO|nr:unnamed protein product [Ostreobium quekettii]
MEPTSGSLERTLLGPGGKWPAGLGPQVPFSHLRVRRCLRCGAFGVVYRALLEGRPVALKLLLSEEGVPTELFIQEAAVLAALDHRSIVRLVGLTVVPAGAQGIPEASSVPRLAIVEDFFERGNLQSLILNQMVSPFTLYSMATALDLMIDIGEALEYLHSRCPTIIHRDVTPGNILLTKENKRLKAKLCDFGVVALIGEGGERMERMHTGLQGELPKRSISRDLCSTIYHDAPSTADVEVPQPAPCGPRNGHVVSIPPVWDMTGETGSYCHMSPENFRSEPYGETADTFSFGMVLYELFARDLVAFSDANPDSPYSAKEFAYRLSKGYRPCMPSHMHPEVASVILKCWKAEPYLRPRMRDVVAELKEIRESGVLRKERRRCSLMCCC